MKLLRVSAFIIAFFGVASTAVAQDTLTLPKGNVSGFATFAATTSDGLSGGHGAGGSGTYFFSRMVGIEGGFRIESFDVTSTDDNGLSGGTLNSSIITFNVVARGAAGQVQPYVSGGVAFFLNSYDIGSASAGLGEFNFVAAEEIDSTIGFNIAGGVDYQFNRRFGIFGEGRVTIAEADTRGGLTDTITGITSDQPGTQKMNIFVLNVGVRIYF